jgi:hypothetical protein
MKVKLIKFIIFVVIIISFSVIVSDWEHFKQGITGF